MSRSGRAARALGFALGFGLGVLLPALAQACPVCFSGSARSRTAFFATTIFLSLLPLGMIGGGVWWLRRSGREWMADEFADRDR